MTLNLCPSTYVQNLRYGPKYGLGRGPIATEFKEAEQKLVFRQNGGENYLRFSFSHGFVFYALDLVEITNNLKRVSPDTLRYFGSVEKLKKYLNELRKFPIQKFLIFCSHCGPLTLCQNSDKSYHK